MIEFFCRSCAKKHELPFRGNVYVGTCDICLKKWVEIAENVKVVAEESAKWIPSEPASDPSKIEQPDDPSELSPQEMKMAS